MFSLVFHLVFLDLQVHIPVYTLGSVPSLGKKAKPDSRAHHILTCFKTKSLSLSSYEKEVFSLSGHYFYTINAPDKYQVSKIPLPYIPMDRNKSIFVHDPILGRLKECSRLSLTTFIAPQQIQVGAEQKSPKC